MKQKMFRVEGCFPHVLMGYASLSFTKEKCRSCRWKNKKCRLMRVEVKVSTRGKRFEFEEISHGGWWIYPGRINERNKKSSDASESVSQ